MTAPTLTQFGFYKLTPAREDVFLAEQRGRTSAHDTPHTGHALLIAWLEPHEHQGERLARLRLPDGGLVTVAAAHVCGAESLARRRILPTPRPAAPHPITRILP